MQKPSSVSALFCGNREEIARNLYLERGTLDAAKRCELNTKLSELDFTSELLKRTGLAPGQVVVDVGCGTGQHLSAYATAIAPSGRAIGVDFSVRAVEAVRARNLMGFVASAESLPLCRQSVDVLTCNYAIYYFKSLYAALGEWARVLQSDGRLVVSGPAFDNNIELYEFHRQVTDRAPSDADLMALGFVDEYVAPALTKYGFTDVQVESLVNVITFPDALIFLDYWVATSLFARTPGAHRRQGEGWFARRSKGPMRVTKRITLVSARTAK